MIPLFPYAMLYFTPLIFTICIISIIYAAATTIRQIDLKKIIAYSSVVHMNFALLGIFTNTSYGIEGSLFFMLGIEVLDGFSKEWGFSNYDLLSNFVQILPQFPKQHFNFPAQICSSGFSILDQALNLFQNCSKILQKKFPRPSYHPKLLSPLLFILLFLTTVLLIMNVPNFVFKLIKPLAPCRIQSLVTL